MINSRQLGIKIMQNQPYTSYRIENSPINLCDHFPITDLYDKKHSPSSDDISYMHFHNYLPRFPALIDILKVL